METEVAADDAAATKEVAGADGPAGAEAAKAAAAATGEGSGDRTDGPEAAGAPSATSTADPSAAAAAPGSEEPQPGVYLKAGEGVFINLPWASSSRAPVEGEIFDGEVLASTGLMVVDAPSSSSDEPEEERLMWKLMSLYCARQVPPHGCQGSPCAALTLLPARISFRRQAVASLQLQPSRGGRLYAPRRVAPAPLPETGALPG